jgi:hypothetical protein
VPCDREGEGLHLPPIPEALNRAGQWTGKGQAHFQPLVLDTILRSNLQSPLIDAHACAISSDEGAKF